MSIIDDGFVHKFSGVTVYDEDDIRRECGIMYSLCNDGTIIHKQLTRSNCKVTCIECIKVLKEMGQSLEHRDEC